MDEEFIDEELIQISKMNFPELVDLSSGDSVTLTITGKVGESDNDNVGIKAMEIKAEIDEGQKFQKDMSKQPGMSNAYDNNSDEDDDI